MTTDAPPLTPLMKRSIRFAVEIRDSALEEIRAATPAWLNTTAGMDRVREIDHMNGWLALMSERYGMAPQELIAAATAEG